MTVSISKMSGKLQGIAAINTNTVTNEYCNKQYSRADPDNICTHCYSQNMLKTFRKNCQPSFERNSNVLASDKALDIPKISRNNNLIRFNGHGELINAAHFLNLCEIAAAYPTKTFALWTKRYDLVKPLLDKTPANMILVYSNPRIDKVMDTPPKGFDKVFNNVSKEFDGEANCTGQKCIDCQVCYNFDTTNVIIEHVK